jgi:hypothetical protein
VTPPAGPPVRRGAPYRLVLGLTLALFALPVLVDLAVAPERTPFHYFAADAFYYFTVARNGAETGRWTFDRERLTNGYHPLWQLTLVGIYDLTGDVGPRETAFLAVVLLLCLALVAGALALLARAMALSDPVTGERRLSPVFALLPVGLYALLVVPAWLRVLAAGNLAEHPFAEGPQPLYGTLWSFVNGMESPLVLLFFAAALAHLARDPALSGRRGAARLGLLLSGLTLARLDHGLLAAAMLMVSALHAWSRRRWRAWPQALTAGIAFGVPVALYLLVNRAVFGSALPVSGRLKSTFPHVSGQFLDKLDEIRELPASSAWLFHVWRETQVLVPLVFALGWLLWALWRVWRRRGTSRVDPALTAAAAGVAALGLYDLLFVDFFHQGHWYLPASVVFVGLVGVRMSEGVSWAPRAALATPATLAILAPLVVASALSLAVFWGLARQPLYHQEFEDFYFDGSRRVVAHYGHRPVKLFSRDDGIVAFSLPYPTFSGTGLAADPEALEHLERGTFLSLAVSRGYDRVTSLAYLDPSGLTPDSPRPVLRRTIPTWWDVQRDWRHLDLSVDYLSEERDFVILRARFVPAGGTAPRSATPGAPATPPPPPATPTGAPPSPLR